MCKYLLCVKAFCLKHSSKKDDRRSLSNDIDESMTDEERTELRSHRSVVHRYLCQVNGVNGGDNVFIRCVSVCVCVQRTGQSDQFKTVKATDFKFDMHVSRVSPDMTP